MLFVNSIIVFPPSDLSLILFKVFSFLHKMLKVVQIFKMIKIICLTYKSI